MAKGTTKARKVTNGGSSASKRKTPGFFGDPETLKSGGATADDYAPYENTYPVEGGARTDIDMRHQPGWEHDGVNEINDRRGQ